MSSLWENYIYGNKQKTLEYSYYVIMKKLFQKGLLIKLQHSFIWKCKSEESLSL
jgi:hypothetical protein